MPRILVVDNDFDVRATTVAGLSRAHREIATACDSEEALRLAPSFAPHLILTDVVMPRLDGWALITRLGAQPETALTPIIVLTSLDSPAARVYALRLGAVDFVGKPFNLDELELRVENALHYCMRGRRSAEAAFAEGVAGSLAHVTLASLLNLFALERKSGELQLALGGDEASILLRDGAIVSASPAHRDGPRGARFLYELLRWEDGSFAFTERAVTSRDEVGVPTMALLMEGARRQDEQMREAHRVA